MTIEEALIELGARDDLLTQSEKEQLDREGYVVFENFLSPQQLEAFRAVLERLTVEEGEDAGKEQHKEAGTDRVADLANKDPIFDSCYIHPRVLSAATHMLGNDIKLFAFSSRTALPGEGGQQFHKDGFQQPDKPGEYHLCNTVWLLDDFTTENGATRIVPGSHLVPGIPPEIAAEPMAAHPNEIQVTAPAGSVIIFNSHLLHSGTKNTTEKPRRAMFVTYCRRDQQQLTDQREYFRPETNARISQAAKILLDVA